MTGKLIHIGWGVGLAIALTAAALAQTTPPAGGQGPIPPAVAVTPVAPTAAQAPTEQAPTKTTLPADQVPSSATITGPAVVLWRGSNQKSDADKGSNKAWYEPFISWPVAAIILMLLILTSEKLMSAVQLMAARISKIKGPAGIEVELTAEVAKEIRSTFGDTLDALMRKADDEYARIVDVAGIWDQLGTIMHATLPVALRNNGLTGPVDPARPNGPTRDRPKARGTIHVPDIIYKEYLYQLTKYYGATEYANYDEGKPGRRFSMRYGIIGRSWRLRESLGTGNAINDTPDVPPILAAVFAAFAPQHQPGELFSPETKKLIKYWGMFPDEAKPGAHGKPAYLCIVLRSTMRVEGLLYIESPDVNAFGTDANDQARGVAAELQVQCAALGANLGEQMKKLREAGPFLKVNR